MAKDNDDLRGGLNSHELGFWVLDSDDEKLYAYGRLNAAPTFSKESMIIKIHRTASANDYVGSVPEVTDPDKDSITYLLTSGGLGGFRMDRQTREIFLRNDAAAFSRGKKYKLTVSVTDSKSALDGSSSDADDAIEVSIIVAHNADPELTTADGTVFSVSEHAACNDTVGQVDATDLDGDFLAYDLKVPPDNPFVFSQGSIKLRSGETLNYEIANSCTATLQVRDTKDGLGQADAKWDGEIEITIIVTNVDEEGDLTLSNSHPQVGTGIIASLTDLDGVNLSNGNRVDWDVKRALDPDSNDWTDVVDSESSSIHFSYTPDADDAGNYLQFSATYKSASSGAQSKGEYVDTQNAVLAESPANGKPVFDGSYSSIRSIAEDAIGGSNVGVPVTATDIENDTITYGFAEYYPDKFGGESDSGQTTLDADATPDYQSG